MKEFEKEMLKGKIEDKALNTFWGGTLLRIIIIAVILGIVAAIGAIFG